MNGQSKLITTHEWQTYFTTVFNDVFRLYLNHIPPLLFMNIYLERIIKITNSTSGYIASYHNTNKKRYLNIEAYYQEKYFPEISFPYKPQINLANENSLCYLSIITKSIRFITNSLIETEFFDEPIKGFSNVSAYICIPYYFGNKVTGVIGLTGGDTYSENNIKHFEVLSSLTGVLQNSYYSIKMVSDNDDHKFITYKLIDDILNLTTNGIIIVDKSFDILYVNNIGYELLEKIYKNSKSQKNMFEIFPQLSLNLSVNENIFKNKKIDISISDKNCEISLELIINTTFYNNNTYNIISLRNYKKDNSKNNNLIAYLSHELRNPLQSITLAGYLIKSEFKDVAIEKNNKISKHINIINKSCSDMKKIINDILDLSRIDAHEFIIELEICRIKDIIDNIYSEYVVGAESKGLKLETNISDKVPETLYTDPTRLCQILHNLVSNGIKYSERGKIELNVSYDEKNHSIIFDISDEGIGIKTDEFCYLFKDFGKTSNCKKNKTSSTGLGLCVSQKISNLLGGNISVKSEYGKGSTFSLYHPIKLGKSGTFLEKAIINENTYGNILLVDDNEYNVKLLRMLLENFNYEYNIRINIESVNNGMDAIKLSNVNDYDIIFLDINMIGIDGYTAGKIIKTNNNFTGKIIATTGNILVSPENRTKTEHEKFECFDDIIIKPFSDVTILSVLSKYLKNNEMMSET